MKNNAKKIWICGFAFLLVFFLILYISNSYLEQEYQDHIENTSARMIGTILKNHPELEDEVMDSILLEQGDVTFGKEILSKYGIDDFSNLTKQENRLKKHTLYHNIILISIVFVIFSLLLYRYVQKEKKSIREIHRYLDRILVGDYSMHIRDYVEGDLSTLKDDIYKVTTILREKENYSIREKKHLESVLSDISHQLKTPLTSMYVINDILENEEIEFDKKKEMLKKNKLQLERIEWLVTSLLKLSRLDSDMVVMKQETVFVRDLIESALEPLKIPMELKEQEIIFDIEDCNVVVDFHWTMEALVNILKNAYEHTPFQNTITISTQNNPIYVEIKIQDNGEGISKEDLPHIFERFYKGSSNKESIGIGLNMAMTIINRQNGVIQVESEKGRGTIFSIKLYKNIL